MKAKRKPAGPVVFRPEVFRMAAGNESVAEQLNPQARRKMEARVECAVQALLDALLIDWRADHNMKGTPGRVARMMVRETFRGRYDPAPSMTEFPNVRRLDELYTVGPITVRSCCSHHLAPIIGRAWIGVVPGKRLIGLSKFARITEWIMARPQIQEEAVVQLADALEELIDPRGLAVVISAEHLCMTWRGVKDPCCKMVNSVMRGLFREAQGTRNEFLSIIKGQGYGDR